MIRRWYGNRSAWGIHISLVAASIVMVYPFIIIVLTAFKSNTEIYLNPYGLPQDWIFTNFSGAWKAAKLGRLFWNSCLLTVASVLLSLAVSSLASYGIAKSLSRYREWIFLLFVAGIFIPFQLSIIPLFKIIKELHLFNTYAGVISVYVAGGIPLGVFLMTAALRAVPKEINEAAVVDGAGYYSTFATISIHLIKPVMSTYAILQGLSVWNDFLIPFLLLTEDSKRTLTTGVMSFKQQYVSNWGFLMAGILIMVVPILVAYMISQRFIIKGIVSGAVKG